MSFQNKFDLMMKDFFKRVACHFNSSEDVVQKLWNNEKIEEKSDRSKEDEKKKSPSKKTPEREHVEDEKEPKKDEHELTREKIISPNTTKDMLASFCEKKGLKKSGKKEDLIQRLLDWLKSSSDTTNHTKPQTSSKKTSPSEEPSVLKNIKEISGELAIRRNKFGNFEHMQTGLVFNPSKKKVFARQMPDGTLKDLVADDIELCNKYKLPYNLPENLNVGKNLDDIKIDEIEEEEELDDEDIEEEELEEDDDPQEEDV